MTVELVNPSTGLPLLRDGDELKDYKGAAFPIINGIPRVCDPENYSESFSFQWNRFVGTQIDSVRTGISQSERRLFSETGWRPDELDDLDILEVGSGAGRFTRVLLEHTSAQVWSVDYSTAVEANSK